MAGPTYTYSHQPDVDDKDAVRTLIADTNYDGNGWLLSDEQILWAIEQEGSQRLAAAMCCEMVAATQSGASRSVSEKRIGDLTLRYGNGANSGGALDWMRLARILRSRVAASATFKAGGILIADKEMDAEDTSITHPSFRRGQFDHPEVEQAGGDWSTQQDWRHI